MALSRKVSRGGYRHNKRSQTNKRKRKRGGKSCCSRHVGGKKSKKRRRKRHRGGAKGTSGGWLSGVGNPVGFSWSGDPSTWPDAGSGCGYTQSNHYAKNNDVVDPPMRSNDLMEGGKRRKKSRRLRGKKRRTMRGGSRNIPLGFAEITDTYRSLTNGIMKAGDTWQGNVKSASLYNSPTWQPIGQPTDSNIYAGSDIKNYQEAARKAVDVN